MQVDHPEPVDKIIPAKLTTMASGPNSVYRSQTPEDLPGHIADIILQPWTNNPRVRKELTQPEIVPETETESNWNTSGKGVFSHSYHIKIIAKYSSHCQNCVPYPWQVYLERMIESITKGARYMVKDRFADELSSSVHPMKNRRNTMSATMTIKLVSSGMWSNACTCIISPPTSTLCKNTWLSSSLNNWNHKYSYSTWNMHYACVSTWVESWSSEWTTIGARIWIGWKPNVTWCWLKYLFWQ